MAAARWYKIRLKQPQEHRHPDKERIDGTDFYDEQRFRDFSTWFQQEKANKVIEADPELYQTDPQDVVSINTRPPSGWNFNGPSAIRKYLKDNPDYFPKPLAEPVQGPTGRMIPGFRVGDLQDFDKRRTGDKLGKAGRRPGTQADAAVGRPSAPLIEEPLAAELSARAGDEPLTATQLAQQYAVEEDDAETPPRFELADDEGFAAVLVLAVVQGAVGVAQGPEEGLPRLPLDHETSCPLFAASHTLMLARAC